MLELDKRRSISRLEDRRGWLGAESADPRDQEDHDTAPPVQRPEKNA